LLTHRSQLAVGSNNQRLSLCAACTLLQRARHSQGSFLLLLQIKLVERTAFVMSTWDEKKETADDVVVHISKPDDGEEDSSGSTDAGGSRASLARASGTRFSLNPRSSLRPSFVRGGGRSSAAMEGLIPDLEDLDALSAGLVSTQKEKVKLSKFDNIIMLRSKAGKVYITVNAAILLVFLVLALIFWGLEDNVGSFLVYNVPAWVWWAYFAVLVAGYSISMVVAGVLVMTAKIMFFTTFLLYYLYKMTFTVGCVFFAIFFIVTYENALVGLSDNGQTTLGDITLCFLVVCICRIPFMMAVKWAIASHRKVEFWAQVTQAQMKEDIMQCLWEWTAHQQELRRRTILQNIESYLETNEPSKKYAPTPSIAAISSRRAQQSGLTHRAQIRTQKFNVVHKLQKKLMKNSPLKLKSSGENVKRILNQEDITKAGKKIFKFLSQCKGQVIATDFQPIFGTNYPSVFFLFDQKGKGSVEEEDFLLVLQEFMEERKNLASTLHDQMSIGRIVHRVFEVVFWTIMLFVVLILIGVSILEQVLPFLGFGLAFSFLFGNSMKNVLESFFFVYFAHPYDVGDRISLDGSNALIVAKINFLTTIAFAPDGRQIILSNSTLFCGHVWNFKRSAEYCMSREIHLDMNTPLEKVTELVKSIQDYFSEESEFWYPDEHLVSLSQIDNCKRMTLSVWCKMRRCNWQTPGVFLMQITKFLLFVKERCNELEIRYILPAQDLHVKLLQGEEPFPDAVVKPKTE